MTHMLKGNHSKNIKYIMGHLYLHNNEQNDWVRIFPMDIGDLKYSVRSDDHRGWLKCDGRSLLRSDYPHLFDIIGTSFGSVDLNHFNLPDTSGRVLGAISSTRTLGQNVGTETQTLTTNELPPHTHTGTTDPSGSHTHTSNAIGNTLGLISSDGNNTASSGLDFTTGEPNLYTSPQALTIDSNGSHTHTFTSGSTGLGQSFNIMQPTSFIGNVFIFGEYTT